MKKTHLVFGFVALSVIALAFQNCGEVSLLGLQAQRLAPPPTDSNPPSTVPTSESTSGCANCIETAVPGCPGQTEASIDHSWSQCFSYYGQNQNQLPPGMATYQSLMIYRDKVTTYKIKKTFGPGNMSFYGGAASALVSISSKPMDPLQFYKSYLPPASNIFEEPVDRDRCMFMLTNAYQSIAPRHYCDVEKILNENPSDQYIYYNIRPVYFEAREGGYVQDSSGAYLLRTPTEVPQQDLCNLTHAVDGLPTCSMGIAF